VDRIGLEKEMTEAKKFKKILDKLINMEYVNQYG
jgi:hypothetical protein